MRVIMVPKLETGKIYRGKLFFEQNKEWVYHTYFVERIIDNPDGPWYASIRVYVPPEDYLGPAFAQWVYFTSYQVGAFEKIPLHEELIFKIQFGTKWGNGGGIA